jgi:hypothetical protein
VSRLSRQCGIFNISQPYRPPRPVTGIALLYLHNLLLPSFLGGKTQHWKSVLHFHFRVYYRSHCLDFIYCTVAMQYYSRHAVPMSFVCDSCAVRITTGCRLNRRSLIPCRAKRLFSISQSPDRLWVHPTSYSMGTRGCFPGG